MWEEWRPSLQQVTTSGGESKLVVVRPSLPGVAPSWPIASTAAAAVMAAISVVTAEVGSEVTPMTPPPIVTIEEKREIGLPTLPDGGTHDSPSWSELEVSGGYVARPEVEHLPMGHGVKVVEVPCTSEAGTRVEPPAIPPLQELAMVRSSAGPSSGLEATRELVWPYLGDLRKAWFILSDGEEVAL